MSDLLTFILARLDEDEAVARAATSGPWRYWLAPEHQANGKQFGMIEANWEDFASGSCACDDVASGYTEDPGDLGQEFDASALRSNDAEHIARHDPARVLAEIQAKRRILAMAQAAGTAANPVGSPTDLMTITDGRSRVLHDVLRLLAQPYADHESFREQWRS